jgi:hypothetical protein
MNFLQQIWGQLQQRSLLRRYATSPKVADSIPIEVTGFPIDLIFSASEACEPVTLGSIQLLRDVSTRNLRED